MSLRVGRFALVVSALALVCVFSGECLELYGRELVVQAEEGIRLDQMLYNPGVVSGTDLIIGPLSSFPAVVPVGEVRDALFAHIGHGFTYVGGPVTIIPSTITDPVSQSVLAEILRAMVDSGPVDPGRRIELVAYSLPAGLSGEWTARVVTSRDAGRGEPSRVTIELTDRGEGERIRLTVMSRSYTKVPVFTRDVAPQEILDEDSVAMSVIEIPYGGEPGLVIETPVGAHEATRSLRMGERVRPGDLQKPRVVDSGDRVNVVFQRGAVVVRTPGTAQGRAGLGDTVAVRTRESGSVFEGVVRNDGNVYVDLQ